MAEPNCPSGALLPVQGPHGCQGYFGLAKLIRIKEGSLQRET